MFTIEKEAALKDHILSCARMFYGVSKDKAKQLAYEYAIKKCKTVPTNWHKNKKAGDDWWRGFCARNMDISLRTPESTSLARAAGFNKTAVNSFFENLVDVNTRVEGGFLPQFVFNLDETGINTVPTRSIKVIAKRGTKQVGNVASGERGTSVTLCCCINALGQALPPCYIFPRVHFKQHMLHGAPQQSLGLANQSGYMTKEIFPCVILHFLQHMNVSPTSPGLLLLDNHSSHVTLEAIETAASHGLHVVTFPPHCSHKLQPLDVGVYGPFKLFYQSYSRDWMQNNPGKYITIYQVAELAGNAFTKAFIISNILSGFRATGIHPINRNIFQDSEFLPSTVTDVPLPSGSNTLEANSLQSNDNDVESEMVDVIPPATTATLDCSSASDDHAILSMLHPLPKSQESQTKKSGQKRRKSYSAIMTDTPEKNKLAASQKKAKKTKKRAPKQKSKKRIFQSHSSSDSDLAISLHDSSDDCVVENDSSSEDEVTSQESSGYAVVKVKGNRGCKNYIAKIIDGPDSDDDYEVHFMRRCEKIKNGFVLSEEDRASVNSADIVNHIQKPDSAASTKRLSNV